MSDWTTGVRRSRRLRANSEARLRTVRSTPAVVDTTSFDNLKPCHMRQESLLSSFDGLTNCGGIRNLCIVLLILVNVRFFWENLSEYGILFDSVKILSVFGANDVQNLSLLVLFSNIFVLAAFITEILLSRSKVSEGAGVLLQTINAVAIVVFPVLVVYKVKPNTTGSMIALAVYTILFLKLISYAMVNNWSRSQIKGQKFRHRNTSEGGDASTNDWIGTKGKGSFVQYPDNLTLFDLYYFLFAPTLCYELNFPRTERINKKFLIRICTELILLGGVIFGLIQQWIVPAVADYVDPNLKLDLIKCAEDIIKLAVPNNIIWLLFFYCYFHTFLNVLAEILRFGDRQFYKDWWNADSIETFWQNWNIPVHKWCVRHIYKPLMIRGYSKMTGRVVVFAVSAFFHEYLVSVPLHMWNFWAFAGMMAQVPLAWVCPYIMKYSPACSNMWVWLSVIIGQPIAIIMYVHDYAVQEAQGTIAMAT